MAGMIKAISLWEPWASLIATGAKTVDTRSWHTHYRGKLLICAAKKVDKRALRLLHTAEFQKGLEGLFEHPPNHGIYCREHLNYGKAVAMADLKFCIRTSVFKAWPEFKEQEPFGDYSQGRFAWVFRNIQRIKEPYPVKGKQGFFNVELPADVEFEELNMTCTDCGTSWDGKTCCPVCKPQQ